MVTHKLMLWTCFGGGLLAQLKAQNFIHGSTPHASLGVCAQVERQNGVSGLPLAFLPEAKVEVAWLSQYNYNTFGLSGAAPPT